jgi:hypothetical protein
MREAMAVHVMISKSRLAGSGKDVVLSIMRAQLAELAYREPEVVMGETVVLVAA